MIKKLTFLLIVFLVSTVTTAMPARAASDHVVISEVQTGGVDAPNQEFVELYNNSTEPIPVTDWKVEYITASGHTTTPLAALRGSLHPHGFLLIGKADYPTNSDIRFDKTLSRTGGHVRIVDQAGKEIDRLSWGTATPTEGSPAPAPKPGQSLRRESDPTALFKDTDQNASDFIVGQPNPTGGGLKADDIPDPATCTGIRLNEILSNPPGTDAEGGEYVEVYNPTDTTVLLKDCTLKTDKAEVISFPADAAVGARGYYALSLKGKLLNGSGEIHLQGIPEDAVAYPTLAEGQAWAIVDDSWQVTTSPTPGAKNIVTAPSRPEKPSPGQGAAATTTLASCPEGKYRNPETNRCKTEATDTATGVLATCKAGQERNPDTNRCKAITSTAGSALAACEPGQERNPETNRCRKVASTLTDGSLKPCPVGQTRNPETNRCRKSEAVTASNHTGQSTDGKENSGNKLHLGILAAAGTAALGYGVYEYRTDLRNWLSKLRAKNNSAATDS